MHLDQSLAKELAKDSESNRINLMIIDSLKDAGQATNTINKELNTDLDACMETVNDVTIKHNALKDKEQKDKQKIKNKNTIIKIESAAIIILLILL